MCLLASLVNQTVFSVCACAFGLVGGGNAGSRYIVSGISSRLVNRILAPIYSAGARSALMRIRTHVRTYVHDRLAFLVRPGALGRLNDEKFKYKKSFQEMKGDRDGKSAKRSPTRYCL